jgi:hypothetical protein
MTAVEGDVIAEQVIDGVTTRLVVDSHRCLRFEEDIPGAGAGIDCFEANETFFEPWIRVFSGYGGNAQYLVVIGGDRADELTVDDIRHSYRPPIAVTAVEVGSELSLTGDDYELRCTMSEVWVVRCPR